RLIPPLSGGVIDCDERGPPRGAAGTLFPQPTVETSDGRIALLDDMLPPGFLGVGGSIDGFSGRGGSDIAILRRLGGLQVALRTAHDFEAAAPDVIVLRAKDELLENWLDEVDAVATVVRPDRYVYGVAHDRLELRRLLAQLDGTLQIRPIDRFR